MFFYRFWGFLGGGNLNLNCFVLDSFITVKLYRNGVLSVHALTGAVLQI